MTDIFIGKNKYKMSDETVKGDIVTIDDEDYYKISNYDSMPPFFMSIVSESDLWMFISSNGALTAGRKDADHALFPYYTDDRIHDSQEITGSKTLIRITLENKTYLWEPFSSKYKNIYHCQANIYKNLTGNKLIFEEINHDLGVTFQYAWLNAENLGFIKKSTLINHNSTEVKIEILDGIQNLLPSGIDRKFQLEYSTLVDGYKKNELLPETGIGIYRLSSVPTDRAEPSESLTATTAWSTGLNREKILISSVQLEKFRQGKPLMPETDVRAERGAYFSAASFNLTSHRQWFTIIDLNQTHSNVAQLSRYLKTAKNIEKEIEQATEVSSEALQIKIAQADGRQLTRDKLNIFRHSANTMFNIMRGGIFAQGYLINKADFQLFLTTANHETAKKYHEHLENLPDTLTFPNLIESFASKNGDIARLCYEYLPLSFSRRHGDPSRPWNQFSIDIKDEQGNQKLNYQGNWRDIFQNWEALAFSFPLYIESMITKFVNASTADGYNPYRVMRNGFDWEVLDPNDSWSYIGYWGDHQIIYLLKLLELSRAYHSKKLQQLLTKKIFTYANVPYRIKCYDKILENPHDTVVFDSALNNTIKEKEKSLGSDAKLLTSPKGKIYTVNLLEKLLIPALVKISNFVPEAGIWMNTQRPEWNDANNALVGNGASMVTLYYLRRYVSFMLSLLQEIDESEISAEVYQLFSDISEALTASESQLAGKISDSHRKEIVDRLSRAGDKHRQTIYTSGFSGNLKNIKSVQLTDFFKKVLRFIDHSIAANQREDLLFHAYNLISFSKREITIRNLYEMLEGQVAILSSGYLNPEESLNLLKSLQKSALYRADQNSYILYPDRQLPGFTEKNILSKELLEKSEILNHFLIQKDQTIIQQDIDGNVHFHSRFRNARLLKQALLEKEISSSEIEEILNIYEAVFDHQSFTGRSGTFYKYEGLGSIYWHMVSKLLLAVQENFFRARQTQAPQAGELRKIYEEIRCGIGIHKNPKDYGAFPVDPYSHTPGHRGVQQPGMTGQVKEDLISRLHELGVYIESGCINFSAELLNVSEFLNSATDFTYYNVNNQKNVIKLNPGSLAFTIAQVPVVYRLSDLEKIKIFYSNNDIEILQGHQLNQKISQAVFNRNHLVIRLEVFINKTKISSE